MPAYSAAAAAFDGVLLLLAFMSIQHAMQLCKVELCVSMGLLQLQTTSPWYRVKCGNIER